MITYLSCSEVEMETIYEGFQIGFSDYIIKITMTKEMFEKRFFGPEGNRLEYSVIALDDGKPVGLNLGAIKVYEGIKTLRCGALCVHPDYRGTEVSKRLFELHHEIARENQCKQMFLEVIVGNDRAINFYRKNGYDKVYDLLYFSHNQPLEIATEVAEAITIKQINVDELRSISEGSIKAIHINWQNDFDYLEQLSEIIHYGAYENGELLGFLSMLPSGGMKMLWVEPEYRDQGIAKGLIHHAVKELSLEKKSINFPNNGNLQNFVKHIGFTQDGNAQYEMYRTV